MCLKNAYRKWILTQLSRKNASVNSRDLTPPISGDGNSYLKYSISLLQILCEQIEEKEQNIASCVDYCWRKNLVDCIIRKKINGSPNRSSCRFWNARLFAYWLDHFSDIERRYQSEISQRKQSATIDMLMGAKIYDDKIYRNLCILALYYSTKRKD